MVQRQELSMQVEARILATLRQPMKLKSRLALRAWEPSVHAPCNKKCKRRQVMHGVHQPSMHLEVCFASCVICPDPIIPSFFQLIHQWLQVHIHIFSGIVGPRNYQRQEHVLSLHKYLIAHKCRGSQQSSRVRVTQFIDSTQGEPKNTYK